MPTNKYQWMIIVITVFVVALVGYGALTMKDNRSVSEKVSDAMDALPQGADKAEQQLESRTPGQKLGDSVKDMGDKIKDRTQPSSAQ